MGSIAPKLGESEFCKFGSAKEIFLLALVMEGQLFAGMYAVDGVGNDFVPKSGGAVVVTAALGHLGKLAACASVNVPWQTEINGLDAGRLGAVSFSPAEKKTGEAEEVEAGDVVIRR